ncbi:hypothetical protein AC629_37605 [Bradyrhizobium sp. NAS80.1]|nr:hypothetical protein AC629_37605 [Bradyrhizobium sp. NAS80.1]
MFSASTCARATASPDRIGPSKDLQIAGSSALGGSATSHQWIEKCCWLIGFAACGFALFLLLTLDVAIEARSLALSVGLMVFLISIYIFYGTWRPAPVLSNICGAVAVLFLSIGMAGIISLVGLRYHFPLVDETLAESDRFLAIDLPSIIAWFADHPALSNLLGIAYDSSFAQLLGLVVLLAVLRREDKLWELVFVCSLTIVAATTVSIVWPAIGAFAYFDHSPDIIEKLPLNAGTYHLAKFEYFRNALSPEISFASLQGVVTFPSFHCCLALMTIFAAAGTRWLFWTVAPWNSLVLISTLPIGGHYVVDLAGGALLWLISAALAAALVRSWRQATPLRDRQIASTADA